MLEITPSKKEIFEIICAKLNLSDSAVVIKEPVLKDTQSIVRPDTLNLRLLRKLSLYVTGLSDGLGSIFVCVLAYRLLADLQWRLQKLSDRKNVWREADAFLHDLERVKRVQVNKWRRCLWNSQQI